MSDRDWLADRFEADRPHLLAVAYRMLGSRAEADDAVQECWVRLDRSDTSGVDNLTGWLTTVVARVCLDMLRSRTARREDSMEARPTPPAAPDDTDPADPEHEAVLADSIGLAMLVVLEALTPAERVAFVLHDMFAVPYDEIAPIVGRTPEASRQLASRARRRVKGAAPATAADRERRRAVVEAFLAASRSGDFEALLTLLDPDVVVRADAAAVRTGADAEVRGADAVAGTFAGRAQAARPAWVDGEAALVWAQGGVPRVVFAFTVVDGTVVAIDLVADPDRLGDLEVVFLDD